MQCWRKYASERPHFEEICNTLKGILEDTRRESYCESDSEDEPDTLSREGSKRFPSRSPSFKSGRIKFNNNMYVIISAHTVVNIKCCLFAGFQNLVRSGSKKLRNSLRRHSMHRREEQTTHTSVSSCENLIPSVSACCIVYVKESLQIILVGHYTGLYICWFNSSYMCLPLLYTS